MLAKALRTRIPAWLTCGLLALMFVTALPQEAAAQDEAAAEETSDEPDNKTMLDQVKAGGWAMYPLGALSIGVVTLVVFNALQLSKGKFVPKALTAQVTDLMSQVRVRSAIETSAASPSFLGRMLATALPHVDATDPETLGREQVEDSIADFTIRETSNYMTWVQYFSVIAQASPMVGLLGTVSGMIKAFETLGIGKGSNPAALAANISEALITTASGLIIAIPALICYYIFKNKLAGLVAEAHKSATDALDAAIATVNADQQLAKVPEGLAEE